MALKVYENVGDTIPYSSEGLFTNPMIFSFDGRLGGSLEKKLYLRNDEIIYKYETITIEAEQFSGDTDYIGDSVGFSFKFEGGDTRPTEARWAAIVADNTISLSDISDTTTYLPFWIRITIPYRIPVQHITSVRMKILATEVLV